ncbi:sigma-54 interaction domain-containing protein [Thauera sinica]|uniref:Sigma-54 interaction domain-containing protein n=1 Tax=Thauera sinica TaxID=2665146 RepID=A0ABW1AMD9_9RHOO|nr:sigma-54 dependent transcriptional regulator [Thauera sp. K11]ATE59171.1 Fis family transcriptional regulator [Thauera sp. K11]
MSPLRHPSLVLTSAPDSTVAEQDDVLTFRAPESLALSIRAKALVFEDPKSRILLARLEKLAPTSASILVRGATGTGKELIARFIHSRSPRAARPFLAVNCGAFSEHLIESELFGHERGAFTGAATAKAGWFEAANGGTLFLDEIGDLPLAQQVKLLRVLQEREVVRLGARRPIPIDVRLVAATNVDLEEAVAAGRFREDLYYRLKVAMLFLPPLRERPADIPRLLEHFVGYYAQRLGAGPAAISPAARELLMRYPWPGNIRELENAVHHAMVVCHGNVLQPDDFALSPLQPPNLPSDGAGKTSLELALRDIFAGNHPEHLSADDYIEETIMRTAFAWCDSNQSATARLLGITRNVVRTRLQRFSLIDD